MYLAETGTAVGEAGGEAGSLQAMRREVRRQRCTKSSTCVFEWDKGGAVSRKAQVGNRARGMG